MIAFEYITVLISIILGLGITQILSGVGNLIKKSHKVIVYWPHLLWVIFVLLLHIQEWWVMYELKSFRPWRLPFFLFIMIYPINLFVLARLLFPNRLKGKSLDLKQFYMKNFRKLFILAIISALFSVLYNVFVLDFNITGQVPQLLFALGITIITLKNYTFDWLHKTVSFAVVSGLVITIIIEWNVWLIK